MTAAEELINTRDWERAARAVLDPGVYGYYAGGAGDEHTLRDNRRAFRRWRLRPRMLVDVSGCSTGSTVLGAPVSFPVLVAPTALHRLAHPDGEGATARAAARAGTVMCLSTIATMTPAEVAAAAPGGRRWFQVYVFRDRGVTRSFVAQAEENGYEALVLTVDAPRFGHRERDLRTGFVVPPEHAVPSFTAAVGGPVAATAAEMAEQFDPTLSWRDVEELASESSVPLLVKGVLTADDARLARDHGAAGVVVSNHGGRQVDGVLASLDALPEVVEAVGHDLEVFVDGGVRRGTDVLVALALGARAVLVGRPVLWGLAVAGEEGVFRVLELFRLELERALALCGCASPADVTAAHAARGQILH
jgi:isopentenyl diphosphate isomerase/L-lactate dehydrogenase-like FMN-dependent dehydrogenase